jgi:Mce-associated membrane protein
VTRARILAPLVLAAVIIAVGAFGAFRAYELRTTPAAQNEAVVDASTTAEVQAFISQGLVQVLTYDFANPDATTSAAEQVLAGDARKEYDQLFDDLAARAPGQQLVLNARVQSVAVTELDGDTAEALVFLDQTSQRATDQEATISAAQLSITATRDGGTWTITGLDTL